MATSLTGPDRADGLQLAQAEQKQAQPKQTEPRKGQPAPDAKKATPRRNPGVLPDTAARRDELLTELYRMLPKADDDEMAKRLSDTIERIWLTSGSDTVDVLMNRAMRAANDKKNDVAIALLTRITELAPDFAEGFNRRAYVYYADGNYVQAMGDLRRVLALDPNHFKALDAMGTVLRELEQKKAALAAYRRLMEINPRWPGTKQAVEELEKDVEGRAL
jgi:tetratricopeptide (TPR) repeat protein